MKKNIIRSAIVGLIMLAVYHVLVFVVPFTRNGAFWLSYAFGLTAFVVLAVASYLGMIKGKNAKSRFYGFPILRMGVTCFVAQIILSLTVMAAGIVPLWVVVVIYGVFLSVVVIGLIAVDSVREEIERQDVTKKKATSMMLALRSKASTLPGLTEDAQIKKALTHLSESFRFSDPVSSDALVEIEQDLASLLDELQKALLEKDSASAETLCKQTELKLTERNSLCKLNK